MDWLLHWPREGLRAFAQALIGLRPAVRRLIPRRLHHVTGQVARWFIRSVETAEPSFEALLVARRLGIAIAAMMPMITTTISNSISEKPFWAFFMAVIGIVWDPKK